MKISVLIPTHNRPALFLRCIESVFRAYSRYPVDLEIIVNNDSNDIEEVTHPLIPVTYLYHKSDNISEIYRVLFTSAKNEYVYFLEDDDVLSTKFFEIVSAYGSDIIYFNYVPATRSKAFIEFCKQSLFNTTKSEFLSQYDDTLFQFGQICFKKSALDLELFPSDNFIKNDFEIFKRLKGSFTSLPDFLYTQTTDGQDNISFVSLNKDPRWAIK